MTIHSYRRARARRGLGPHRITPSGPVLKHRLHSGRAYRVGVDVGYPALDPGQRWPGARMVWKNTQYSPSRRIVSCDSDATGCAALPATGPDSFLPAGRFTLRLKPGPATAADDRLDYTLDGRFAPHCDDSGCTVAGPWGLLLQRQPDDSWRSSYTTDELQATASCRLRGKIVARHTYAEAGATWQMRFSGLVTHGDRIVPTNVTGEVTSDQVAVDPVAQAKGCPGSLSLHATFAGEISQ